MYVVSPNAEKAKPVPARPLQILLAVVRFELPGELPPTSVTPARTRAYHNLLALWRAGELRALAGARGLVRRCCGSDSDPVPEAFCHPVKTYAVSPPPAPRAEERGAGEEGALEEVLEEFDVVASSLKPADLGPWERALPEALALTYLEKLLRSDNPSSRATLQAESLALGPSRLAGALSKLVDKKNEGGRW